MAWGDGRYHCIADLERYNVLTLATYRLKKALVSIARNPDGDLNIVTLYIGNVVRTVQSEPLPQSGLVDVVVDGKQLSVFVQDLQTRGELMESATS